MAWNDGCIKKETSISISNVVISMYYGIIFRIYCNTVLKTSMLDEMLAFYLSNTLKMVQEVQVIGYEPSKIYKKVLT